MNSMITKPLTCDPSRALPVHTLLGSLRGPALDFIDADLLEGCPIVSLTTTDESGFSVFVHVFVRGNEKQFVLL